MKETIKSLVALMQDDFLGRAVVLALIVLVLLLAAAIFLFALEPVLTLFLS